MAIAAEALPELLGAGEAGGAGAGMGMDFNDLPFGKLLGSHGGSPVSGIIHTVEGAIGTHGPEERAPIGPMGSLA